MNRAERRFKLAQARARHQHQQKIEKIYNDYHEGQAILLNPHIYKSKMRAHVILEKHEFDGKYYFIIQDKHEKVYLARVIGNSYSPLKKISRKSEEYIENKDTFDSWISHAKEGRKTEMLNFFEQYQTKFILIDVVENIYNFSIALYKYISKYTYNGKHYFVVESEDEYFVAKVAWYGTTMVVRLTDKEFEKNKSVFEAWIQNAKNNNKKKA